MGFMDKTMDRAMDKLEERFGALVKELNEMDGLMKEMVAEQKKTNQILEALVQKIGG